MAYDAEGELRIDAVDFWTWVMEWAEKNARFTYDCEIVFGKPRFSEDGNDLVISFAVSSDEDPNTWATRPKAAKEWEEE